MTQPRRIHVWIGDFRGSDADWVSYFDVDELGSACGFCRDAGVDWFDLDMVSSYNAGTVMPVEDVIMEVPYSEQFEDELLAACRSFGVGEASHCFTIINFDGRVVPGSHYLGLTSVGAFAFSA
jgi:hypothetical protein